jgi:hypothetical protein
MMIDQWPMNYFQSNPFSGKIHWVSIGVLAEIKFATGYLLLGTWQMEDYVQSSFS